ncbi:MAG: phosphoribulokinase [Burkholderiales bacterium]|nr:phosphoribulokinase [Burkholderiales bacterium]
MSAEHPIIAITGSSGAGTTSVSKTFAQIFRREGVKAAFVQGDAFHRYDRAEMREKMAEALARGNHHFSHFGPEANLFEELEGLFRNYAETGRGRTRKYLHDEQEAALYGQKPGTFTAWEDLPAGTDVLVYEGLHGGVVTDTVNVAQHVDLLIGVVPVINLEWIQKLHRDRATRGYSTEAVTDTILRRMPDYVRYIVPQFSRTHINFQRVPVVDTSNPFIARHVPTADESMLVIRFANPRGIDFPYLLAMLHDSFMSRPNTIVCPGGKMDLAMQLIFTPMIWRLVEQRRRALAAEERAPLRI